MACLFNQSTQKVESGRSLQVRGQLGLHSDFQTNQSYNSETLFQKKEGGGERKREVIENKISELGDIQIKLIQCECS